MPRQTRPDQTRPGRLRQKSVKAISHPKRVYTRIASSAQFKTHGLPEHGLYTGPITTGSHYQTPCFASCTLILHSLSLGNERSIATTNTRSLLEPGFCKARSTAPPLSIATSLWSQHTSCPPPSYCNIVKNSFRSTRGCSWQPQTTLFSRWGVKDTTSMTPTLVELFP